MKKIILFVSLLLGFGLFSAFFPKFLYWTATTFSVSEILFAMGVSMGFFLFVNYLIAEPVKIKEFRVVDYNNELYYWAISEDGKIYFGEASKEKPNIIDWELLKTPAQ